MEFNRFNVYGPDGEKLQPFIMSQGLNPIRMYPDSEGKIVLGNHFQTPDGTYMGILPMGNYTIVLIYVEYEGQLAIIRFQATPLSENSSEIETDGLKIAVDSRLDGCVTGPAEDFSGSVAVPEKVEWMGSEITVRYIGAGAFKHSDVTDVKVGSAMTEIRDSAFFACPRLESVEIRDNSDRLILGNHAFSYCENLTSVTFPGCTGRFIWSSQLFEGDNSLKSINIPKGQNVTDPGQCGLYSATIIENNEEYAKIRIDSRFCDINGNPLPVCLYTFNRDSSTGSNSKTVHIFRPTDGIVTVPKEMCYDRYTDGRAIYNPIIFLGYENTGDPYLNSWVAEGDASASRIGLIRVPETGLPLSVQTDGITYMPTDSGTASVAECEGAGKFVYIPSAIEFNGSWLEVSDMAENVMADNTSVSALVLPEGCRANNIFGVISEPMDVENSPERNFGAIKATLMSNTADEIVVKVESDIFCGLEKLPMCVALYKEDGPHIFALSDGAATIPVSALSDSKTRSVAQTVAIGIGFDKNLLLPGISDGYSLATVCVQPKESSGIEGIEADSQDEAEFYNLQGVRMDKGALVPGVYIRVQNGMARKTAVK